MFIQDCMSLNYETISNDIISTIDNFILKISSSQMMLKGWVIKSYSFRQKLVNFQKQ